MTPRALRRARQALSARHALQGRRRGSRPARRGRFIAIEGTDGAGKATQARLLARSLRRRGHRVHVIAFPQYGHSSAAPIEAFLNGDYGHGDAFGPERSSLLYAVDRVAARGQIHRWLSAGDVVIADRYTASNLAHQGGKITDAEARRRFWRWLEELEYGALELPRPDRTLVLLVPPETAAKLVLTKKPRAYIRRGRRDMVERDRAYQRRSYEVYQELCRRDRHCRAIDCTAGGKLLSRQAVHERVVEALRSLW